MKITLTRNEHKRAVILHEIARNAPVIIIDGINKSDEAWDKLREHLEYLASKYRYDPASASISPKSRTIEATKLKDGWETL